MTRLPKVISVDDHVVEPPHTDTTWPFVQEEVERMTAALTEEQRYKVLRGNAIRMLDLDRV